MLRIFQLASKVYRFFSALTELLLSLCLNLSVLRLFSVGTTAIPASTRVLSSSAARAVGCPRGACFLGILARKVQYLALKVLTVLMAARVGHLSFLPVPFVWLVPTAPGIESSELPCMKLQVTVEENICIHLLFGHSISHSTLIRCRVYETSCWVGLRLVIFRCSVPLPTLFFRPFSWLLLS